MTEGLTQRIEGLECAGGDVTYMVGHPCPHQPPRKVREIGEHSPQGPGDVWMYNVIFEDGSATRVFNQTRVFFGKPCKALAVPEKKKLIV